jgi:predicted porin
MTQPRRIASLFAGAVLAGAAGSASADAGLGAAFESGSNDTGTTIMVPIRLKGMLIEPQLAYVDQKAQGSTFKVTQPGIGLYLTKEVGPQFEMYYGGILGYSQIKQNNGVTPESKSTTFVIQPTIGVQHYFSKQFAIGVDAGIQYQDGTTKTSGAPDQDIRIWSTVTRIIARAYFF